jgi:hypothetical protein
MSTRHILYKLKSALAGGKVADAIDIEATGDTTVQAELDTLKTSMAHPVNIGQSFRFNDADLTYEGLVFAVQDSTFEIAFSDGTLDIPGVPGGPFHAVGAYLVSQYTEGLVFSKVTSSSSVSGSAGDIDAEIVETVSFTDGGSFTVPNTQPGVRLGVMVTEVDNNGDSIPDLTKVIYVSNAGDNSNDGRSIAKPKQTIASALTAARAINGWVYCPDGSEFSIGSVILENGDKIYAPKAKLNGNISGPMSGRVDVKFYSHTGLLGIGTGDHFDFDYGNSGVTIQGVSHDDSFFRCGHFNGSTSYDSLAIGALHLEIGFSNIDFESGKPSGLDLTGYVSDTFFGASGGGNGIQYTDGAGENNELVAKTGTDGQAKGTGIVLNALGRIPFEKIGEADLVLTGSGGTLTLNSSNIDTYKNRTIFIDHTNTFTINLGTIDTYYTANKDPFFLRFANRSDKLVTVQGTTSATIGGRTRQRISENGSLTIELPPQGQTNWPVLAAGNPLRSFDIVQVTSSTSYDDDAKLEQICDHLLEVSGTNIALSFASSSLDCAFYVHNQGTSNVTLEGIGSASASGYVTLTPGDLAWVWNISSNNIYRAIKLGNTNETIPDILPNDTPIVDTLIGHTGGNPGSTTSHQLAIKPNWTGSRNLRIRVGSVNISLGAITAVAGLIDRIDYQITSANWNTLYTGSPTHLQWWLQWDNNGTWETIYSARIPV